MRLTDVIHGKLSLRADATATPATPATDNPLNASTVAGVAAVAVANPPSDKIDRLTFVDEVSIRTWLAGIGEQDRETVAGVIKHCRLNADARVYFLTLAREKAKGVELWPDDRIHCHDCVHLSFAGVCLIAGPSGTVIAAKGYKPVDMPRRCEHYSERGEGRPGGR